MPRISTKACSSIRCSRRSSSTFSRSRSSACRARSTRRRGASGRIPDIASAGFRGGPFLEPLATIAFAWGNLDDFSVGGNAVDFKDETNVRGRLGLRLGTSYQVWPGTTMEPFVIGSVWSTLSGSNEVTLKSTNTTFRLIDEPDDVWGVASAGVNFFNPSKQTSVFAEVDWTFGEETDGIAGRAGLRVSW